MKKILAIILVVSLLSSLYVPCFANSQKYDLHYEYGNYYEYDYEYYDEHYVVKTVTEDKHPHKGYRICNCGLVEYFDNTYSSECDTCYDQWHDFEGVDEYWQHEHAFENITTSQSHPHRGSRACYCGYEEKFSKSYSTQCSICKREGMPSNPDDEEKVIYEGQKDSNGHTHKESSRSYTVNHPHLITYKCKCGFTWNNKEYEYEKDCKDCNLGLVGVYTEEHMCTYNSYEEISNTHPHDIVSYCECGKIFEQKNIFLANCSGCSNHKHEYLDLGYEDNHPHNLYYECECSLKKYLGSRTFLKDCERCQKEEEELKNHTHDFSVYYYEDEHPHWEYYGCDCGARQYLENQRFEVDDCSECIIFNQSHTHSYDERYYHDLHPHSVYEKCECGAYSYLGYCEYVNDCDKCSEELKSHTHNFNNYYFESAHPHWEYYGCDCGAREYLYNQRTTCSDCSECIAFEKNHKHVFNQQYCYKTHPHENYRICDCGAYSLMGIYTYFDNCSQCISERKQAESQGSMYVLNGVPVTKEEYFAATETDDSYYIDDSNDEYYYDVKVIDNSSDIDVRAISQQIVLGEYAPKTTLLGTVGEVIAGVLGIDAWKDVTDMVYYLTHWENNWNHYSKVFINGLAILPGVGVLKNADEVKAVRKYIEAYDAVSKKISKFSKADIVRLASKAVDPKNHAYTKHVGKSASEMKAMLKANKWGKGAEISSFSNSKIADQAIELAVKNNVTAIAKGLSKEGTTPFAIEYDMKKVIGNGYFKNSDKLQNATRVRVIIKKTGNSDFVIRTAFPVK